MSISANKQLVSLFMSLLGSKALGFVNVLDCHYKNNYSLLNNL